MQYTTLANTPISSGENVAAYADRLLVPRAGQIVAVRKPLVWAPGYGAGDGGLLQYQLQADDGVAGQHFPSGTVLGQSAPVQPTQLPGARANDGFSLVAFQAPVAVQAGQYVHLVLLNQAANPAANYVSANDGYDGLPGSWSPTRPPGRDPADLAVLLNDGQRWSATRDERDHYLAIVELVYADGSSFGMGYLEPGSTAAGSDEAGVHTLDGTGAVREVFTVSGPGRVATGLQLRLYRESGSGDVTVTLSANGQVQAAVPVPAGALRLGGKGTGQGPVTDGEWVTVSLPPTPLQPGQRYELTLTTAAGSRYQVQAMRDGAATSLGFGPGTVFADGYAQYTTGGAWTNWDTWGVPQLPGDQDLPFLFLLQ
jgi:hypothetical protein